MWIIHVKKCKTLINHTKITYDNTVGTKFDKIRRNGKHLILLGKSNITDYSCININQPKNEPEIRMENTDDKENGRQKMHKKKMMSQ